MEDLHKLNYIYKRCQKKYGAQKYEACNEDCDNLKNSKWLLKLLLNIKIGESYFKFILAIPETFPYVYPYIYLHNEHKDLKKLPHIDKNSFICTFNKKTNPNIYKPLEVCEEVINRAKKILNEGLNKKNFKDYEDEFLAYWADESPNIDIVSIVKPQNFVKDVCVIDIRNLEFVNYKYLVADNLLDGINWLSNTGLSIASNPLYHSYGVYFPIKTAKFEIVPHSNKEILTFLQGNSLKELFEHLNTKKRPSLVLCNYNNSMFAWEHQEYQDIVKRGKKSLRIKHQQGFRKGKQLTSLELSSFAKENKIKRYNVKRFDKERLFERGAEGLQVNQQYKINLFGCGAIGSYLLNSLIQVGFNNFKIIDKEYFEAENLTRHICDIDDLKKLTFKVDALIKKMQKKYPLINIETFTDDIILLAKNNLNLLNSANLNILCLGDYNIELLFSNLLAQNEFTVPLLIIWVEPYLVAGHFVFITPNNKFSYEELYTIENNNLIYNYNISSRIMNNYKQEAGCQSIYIPYGTLSISSFINNVTFLIQEISNKNIDTGCIYRWSKGKNILESKMEKMQ